MQISEQHTLTQAEQKAATEAAYRARRKARKHELVELHQSGCGRRKCQKAENPPF
ncbi:hypothetical protein FORC4_p084 (plasmid) [Vibrio parahaemolyticus]|uniref:hypothetical protein n=1 Tax=Vibrio parahaemolyticus TaxID=670 RepID=UPI0007223E22|nr:hypothetical protein FORC4_p084 [Vibrio parahaemolyticus]